MLEGNVVAGCSHYGYWYRLLDKPAEASQAQYSGICPNAQPFGRFTNNQVHSTGRYGVWIYPQYAPSISGCGWSAIPQQAIFDGLIAWSNDRGMEWVMSRTIQIRNALVFDNSDVGIATISAIHHSEPASSTLLRSTFYSLENGSSVIDSIIIGFSTTDSSAAMPLTAGLIGKTSSYFGTMTVQWILVMWDRGLRIHNVTFINFPNTTRALYGPTIPDRCVSQSSGRSNEKQSSQLDSMIILFLSSTSRMANKILQFDFHRCISAWRISSTKRRDLSRNRWHTDWTESVLAHGTEWSQQ